MEPKDRGESHVKTEDRLELCCHKPRDTYPLGPQSREGKNDSALEPLKGVRPCLHLGFRPWIPELWENKPLLFEALWFVGTLL